MELETENGSSNHETQHIKDSSGSIEGSEMSQTPGEPNGSDSGVQGESIDELHTYQTGLEEDTTTTRLEEDTTTDVSSGRVSPPPLDSQDEDDTVEQEDEINSQINTTHDITEDTENEQNDNVVVQAETEDQGGTIDEGNETATIENREQLLNSDDASIDQPTANDTVEVHESQGNTASDNEETNSVFIDTEGGTQGDDGEVAAVRVLPATQRPPVDSDGDHSNGNNNGRRVHFSEEIRVHELNRGSSSSTSSTRDIINEVVSSPGGIPASPTSPSRESLPCVPQLSAQQLTEGVVYQAQYLGSTPVIFSQNQRTVRMQQAREAVRLLKEAQGDTQPRIDVDLKINTKNLVLADRKSETDLITHPLRTVSYVADIDNSLVIMAHRNPPSSPGTPLKLNCHIIETADPREVAMVIGQAFSTAYKEFLKSHGIKEESLEKFEYQHVLSSQSKSYLEINSLVDDNQTKEISFAKHKGDMLGIMLIDSGYGSAIPSCIVAHMNKSCAGSKSGLINVGDHILSVNGTSLVGMPLKLAIEQIKKCRNLNVVKMVTSSCPPVVDVTIMRPDLKFQLGFSVKDGNICSLWRGSIAERSGVRVGHRIIEINGTSVVGLVHDEIVHMLSTTVGDIHIRTMPMVMYQLLTGQITPEYY